MHISYNTAFLCPFWMHIFESMCVFLRAFLVAWKILWTEEPGRLQCMEPGRLQSMGHD